MGKLLFILALLPIGLIGQAQTTRTLYTSPWKMSMAQMEDPSIHEEPSTIDTVAVWLDCADTTGRNIAYNVSIRGYEIKKLVKRKYPVYVYPNTPGYDWVHIGYLNSFKKPLIGYLVWGTKEINSK
jgi:hypothetical protein